MINILKAHYDMWGEVGLDIELIINGTDIGLWLIKLIK